MAVPREKPTIRSYARAIWREPGWRVVIIALLSIVFIVVALNIYNAAYVYEDWRCLTADCKILKHADGELLRVGEDL